MLDQEDFNQNVSLIKNKNLMDVSSFCMESHIGPWNARSLKVNTKILQRNDKFHIKTSMSSSYKYHKELDNIGQKKIRRNKTVPIKQFITESHGQVQFPPIVHHERSHSFKTRILNGYIIHKNSWKPQKMVNVNKSSSLECDPLNKCSFSKQIKSMKWINVHKNYSSRIKIKEISQLKKATPKLSLNC